MLNEQDAVLISLYCATQGASIAYRMSGKDQPVGDWLLYTEPIRVQRTTPATAIIIQAQGFRIGYQASPVTALRIQL